MEQKNKTSAVDSRIAAVIARRAGASSTASFEIIREDGKEVETRRQRNDGRQDVTVPSVQAPTERDSRGTIGDEYTAPSNDPKEPVRIGSMTLYRSGLTGWERQLTRDASDYELHLSDGRVVRRPDEIL